MRIHSKTANPLIHFSLPPTAIRTIKYGTAIVVISGILGRSPGLIPSISALSVSYLLADQYRQEPAANASRIFAPKTILKYGLASIGYMLIFLSQSPQVIGKFMLSVLLVTGLIRMRQSAVSSSVNKVV